MYTALISKGFHKVLTCCNLLSLGLTYQCYRGDEMKKISTVLLLSILVLLLGCTYPTPNNPDTNNSENASNSTDETVTPPNDNPILTPEDEEESNDPFKLKPIKLTEVIVTPFNDGFVAYLTYENENDFYVWGDFPVKTIGLDSISGLNYCYDCTHSNHSSSNNPIISNGMIRYEKGTHTLAVYEFPNQNTLFKVQSVHYTPYATDEVYTHSDESNTINYYENDYKYTVLLYGQENDRRGDMIYARSIFQCKIFVEPNSQINTSDYIYESDYVKSRPYLRYTYSSPNGIVNITKDGMKIIYVYEVQYD